MEVKLLLNLVNVKILFLYNLYVAELPSERSLFLVWIDLRIPVVSHGFEKHLTWRREIDLKGACLLTILFSSLL